MNKRPPSFKGRMDEDISRERTKITERKLQLLKENSDGKLSSWFFDNPSDIAVNELWLSLVLPGFSGLQGINWANIFWDAYLHWTTSGTIKAKLTQGDFDRDEYVKIISSDMYNPIDLQLDDGEKETIKQIIHDTKRMCFIFFEKVKLNQLVESRNITDANNINPYSSDVRDPMTPHQKNITCVLIDEAKKQRLAFNELHKSSNHIKTTFNTMPEIVKPNIPEDEGITEITTESRERITFLSNFWKEIREVDQKIPSNNGFADMGIVPSCTIYGGSKRKQRRTKKNKKTKKQRKQRKHQKKSKRSRRSHTRSHCKKR
jgi:hypothetical protein